MDGNGQFSHLVKFINWILSKITLSQDRLQRNEKAYLPAFVTATLALNQSAKGENIIWLKPRCFPSSKTWAPFIKNSVVVMASHGDF